MRFRLYPTPAQALVLERHCADARFMWNLVLEQWNWYPWTPGHKHAPSFVEQCRQLSELRESECWIAEGSRVVQTQALRDFEQAKRYFFAGTHRRPRWRVKGLDEGFRIVDARWVHPRKLNRHWAEVLIPKAGWVRFRWSRNPGLPKSFRVTLLAGQWHIAFACIPVPVEGPGDGSLIGIDRGVTIPFACSDGTSYTLPAEDAVKLRRLQRHLARQKKGSGRRQRTKTRIAKVRATDGRRRKDAIEKATTDLAQRCDYFRIEDLRTGAMTRSAKRTVAEPLGKIIRQKAGLNREILKRGWALFARRLDNKAPYRVERVNPAFTSQRCATCGHTAPENRKSQAVFRCVSCGHEANADLNAARNIAAGHAVTARGGWVLQGPPTNREPQPSGWNPSVEAGGGCQMETHRRDLLASPLRSPVFLHVEDLGVVLLGR